MGCCYREIHVKFLYIYGNCNALHYVFIIVIMERDVQLCFLNCSQSVHEIFMVYFKFSNSIRRCSMMYFFIVAGVLVKYSWCILKCSYGIFSSNIIGKNISSVRKSHQTNN